MGAVQDVRRILVATDRSESAERAVAWAAEMASRYDAELHVLQVLPPGDAARARVAGAELERHAAALAGERGRASLVVHDAPADAIVAATERLGIDVLVVGNVGMSDRKEFLLGNVPNRVSHNARCTVVIVNTAAPPEPERRGLLRRR
ncbi:MAG: universal stress protein [Thermoleophilia bacterium]